MTQRTSTTGRTRGAAPTSPLSFRMPTALRSRLRHFAEERSLGEAEALRLALSERLNEVDDERELAAAERWQFQQAYMTWQNYLSGKEKLIGRKEIDRVFERALTPRAPRRRHKR